MPNIPAITLSAENLKTYVPVQRWIRGKAEKTVDTYLRSLAVYCKRSGRNPDQVLEWAKTVVNPVEVQDSIDKYAEGLKDGVSFNFKIDMRSFLRHAGFNSLPKSKIEYSLQQWHRGYKKEEI